MPNSTTYDTDFYLWTQQQAALLRQGQTMELDMANLAEEIEDMGKDRKSTRLNSSHSDRSRMPSSA